LLALGTGHGQETHTTQVLARRRSAEVNGKCITHLKPAFFSLRALDVNCGQVISTVTSEFLDAHQLKSAEEADLPLRRFWGLSCRQCH
jgi:hypothetical protein